ncbi:hypothetical protein SCHPADRAFT_837224 [Schizopora paradoxa]|uniref:PIH1 N-terminal domain-containing protein n=1 Tax=Schizopora paradoxa TaxID=27342 RepID=A0A0H2R6Q6_9AGAM|nr:hypothetical protein SCHPADRAFT_837224 [Schizopora paradoxa]
MASFISNLSTLSSSSASSSKQDTTLVKLKPTPGFVIKSVVTEPGFYAFSPEPSSSKPTSPNVLEPKAQPRRVAIPKGQKVFLNIAWDLVVPPPPPADEATIRRAMAGADLDVGFESGAYFVPVVVSEPREDKDKAGNPSLVFDCIFNITLKSRCTKDPEFKMYILELALEHVEAKANMQLSRQIGTPNIASKGKLEPRSAMIPNALLDPSQAQGPSLSKKSKPLVQELSTGTKSAETDKLEAQKPKSILKPSMASTNGTTSKTPMIQEIDEPNGGSPRSADLDVMHDGNLPPPCWKWTKEGERIKIDIDVPTLTRELCETSTLDVEARRIILHIPNQYHLDINLAVPDAEIAKIETGKFHGEDKFMFEMNKDAMRMRGQNAGEAMRLKRCRDLDVEGARAQWMVRERRIVLWV